VLTEVGNAGGKRERGTDPQVRTAQIEQAATVAVGEEAKVANAHETLGQNMEQKTAQEFIGVQSHDASLVAMGVVSPTEGDLAFVYG